MDTIDDRLSAAETALAAVARERDELRAALSAPLPPSPNGGIDVTPDAAGRLIATIRGRGSDIIGTLSRTDSRAIALLSLARLAGDER